jgi:glyoxylase-like metal-dependent hydrolase (beta-lactamase superfamily II)
MLRAGNVKDQASDLGSSSGARHAAALATSTGYPAFIDDLPRANTGFEAAVQRLASTLVISDADIQPLVSDLFRVRIPTALAHALNCYLWLGPDGVTVVDTGWADSAPVIARALELLGRRTSDVERIVLSHFHDDHVGSAATVAQWSRSTVVAGRADTPFIRGVEEGPWPTLTAAEQALNPPMPGTVALPPPCRVDHEAADGDVLDFAGGAVVLHVGGHTPGSIALHLPRLGVLLTGDLVAESRGNVIVGPFNTDRDQSKRSINRLVGTDAHIAGFGHGEPVPSDAAYRLEHCTDPLA